MPHETLQPEQFERHRRQLERSPTGCSDPSSEAEDAVQEAWLRVNRSRPASIENVGGFLTTVVGRVCIDMLRARRARPEDAAGDRLPEPIVGADDHSDPEQETLLADAVGIALLVVLDTLTPPSGWRSCCTTCSRCRSTRSPRSSIARPRPPASSPAAPGGGCAAGAGARRRHDRQRAVVAAFLAASRAGTSMRCWRSSTRAS